MSKKLHMLVLAGTRPEVVKLAPVINSLRKNPQIRVTVAATGQHREMLAQAFADFSITPDINLDVMTEAQSLAGLSSILFLKLDACLEEQRPDWLIIQGDTTTVMVAALCAFYRNIRIGHVEAGLRSFNPRSPFPEEINRKVAALVADAHFAPTNEARLNLLREGVADANILVTGNTVVDALMERVRSLAITPPELPVILEDALNAGKRLVLVTAHRRENHGRPLENICAALKRMADSRTDALFIYPVHLNPAVRDTVFKALGNHDRILLTDPLPYSALLHVLAKADVVLTDSGGIQEEACVLRKPALVLRDTTERMEGVRSGAAALLGSDVDKIRQAVMELLDNENKAREMSAAAGELYGDGNAARRIAEFYGKLCL